MIIANYHPSGNRAPSWRKSAMTIEMRETCENFNILLHHDFRMGGGKTWVGLKVLFYSRLFLQFSDHTVVATSPETPLQFLGHS
ncbi:MAG: hypothetical protein CMM45_04340 [Rhodospirillaceae bacterium]|nr:hypothetical protein [Rhodospirillaceae bacterium]